MPVLCTAVCGRGEGRERQELGIGKDEEGEEMRPRERKREKRKALPSFRPQGKRRRRRRRGRMDTIGKSKEGDGDSPFGLYTRTWSPRKPRQGAGEFLRNELAQGHFSAALLWPLSPSCGCCFALSLSHSPGLPVFGRRRRRRCGPSFARTNGKEREARLAAPSTA